MDGASHFHTNYSTNHGPNGHSSPPFGSAPNDSAKHYKESDQSDDQQGDKITMRVTREEAEFLYQRRRTEFQQDPGAESESSASSTANPRAEKRQAWIPTPISQLHSEGESVPWLWGGYIARGHKTSFTGLWKTGKTTLLKYLRKSMDGGAAEFCGQVVACAKVLVISEESARLWAGRRDEIGLTDNIHLITLPFLGRPQLTEWTAFVAQLAAAQASEGYDLIVFDSMHNLWGVTDENNNAEVLGYLTTLNLLTEQGTAVLLVAHPSKGDSGEGRATRGGGAWGGFVDIILEMRRHDADNRDDTRRVLTAYSRWEDTRGELVIELDKENGEYRAVGTKAEARAQDRMDIYVSILPKGEPGMTDNEIREAWPIGTIAKPSARTITRDLDQAIIEGKVRCNGAGKKNDPRRYSIPDI